MDEKKVDNMEKVENMDKIVNNEVENPELVKDMPESTEIEVKVAVNSEKTDDTAKVEAITLFNLKPLEDENEVKVE